MHGHSLYEFSIRPARSSIIYHFFDFVGGVLMQAYGSDVSEAPPPQAALGNTTLRLESQSRPMFGALS